MTVPTEVSRVTYAGNDVTTDFSTGFYFLAASDVKVTLDTGVSILAKVEGIDYALSVPLAGSGAAGTVEMYTPPRPGQTLIIVRDVPLTQDTSFRSQGSFSPSVHEDAMDRLMFAIQELDRRTGDLESAGAPGSVIAGDGVSFTSTTLNVGAGNGIQVNPDTVEVLYGSLGSMVAVAKSSAAAGVANTAARIDHKHDITTAAPAAGAVLVGNAAAEGSATTLARSDHTHALAAPAAPADVTKAAATAGVATTVARSDHKHDVSTASATDITDSANAEGSATTLARSDHTHSHGARGGGTLHAVATTSVAGFLSAADKTLLDAALATKTRVRAITTAGQTLVADVYTLVVFGTETYDTKNEFNAGTGVFTATEAGYYHVTAQVTLAVVAQSAGPYVNIVLRKNGSNLVLGAYDYADAAQTKALIGSLSTTVLLAASDTLDVVALVSPSSKTVNTSSLATWFTIDRLP
jgi:hypothetical protein